MPFCDFFRADVIGVVVVDNVIIAVFALTFGPFCCVNDRMARPQLLGEYLPRWTLYSSN